MENDTNNSSPTAWEQRIFEDNYTDTRQINLLNAQARIQADKEIFITQSRQNIQTQAALDRNANRFVLREMENDLRESKFRQISISDSGEVITVTRSSFVHSQPRAITNLLFPYLSRYIRLSNHDDFAYLLSGTLNSCDESVFLDSARIGSGTYIVNKLAAHGIVIHSDKPSVQKKLAQQLMAYLLQLEIEDFYIPDAPGWVLLSNGCFNFYGEECLLWKTVVNRIR